MKLSELKKCVDAAVKHAKPCEIDYDVEVWCKDVEFEITGMTQGQIIPDVSIIIKKVKRN